MILFISCGKAHARLHRITKLILLAKKLRAMNNYFSLMGIIVALNMSSIQRLKASYSFVKKKHQTAFMDLEVLMRPQGSFTVYRQVLQSSKLPCLPYLGVYLTDLTFLEDGNPDNIGQYINFHKRQSVHRVIDHIHKYQLVPFLFEKSNVIFSTLYEMPFSEEKELYQLSLTREGRIVR